MQSTPTRRGMLTGRWSAEAGAIRPPWSVADRFGRACTQCDECQKACPEEIITKDKAGLPVVDFSKGECVLCGACADSCPSNVFAERSTVPWSIKPSIGSLCLTERGVVCQTCRESCPENAIKMRVRLGNAATPQITLEDCTGCGGCVATCPTGAITMSEWAEGA